MSAALTPTERLRAVLSEGGPTVSADLARLVLSERDQLAGYLDAANAKLRMLALQTDTLTDYADGVETDARRWATLLRNRAKSIQVTLAPPSPAADGKAEA